MLTGDADVKQNFIDINYMPWEVMQSVAFFPLLFKTVRVMQDRLRRLILK